MEDGQAELTWAAQNGLPAFRLLETDPSINTALKLQTVLIS